MPEGKRRARGLRREARGLRGRGEHGDDGDGGLQEEYGRGTEVVTCEGKDRKTGLLAGSKSSKDRTCKKPVPTGLDRTALVKTGDSAGFVKTGPGQHRFPFFENTLNLNSQFPFMPPQSIVTLHSSLFTLTSVHQQITFTASQPCCRRRAAAACVFAVTSSSRPCYSAASSSVSSFGEHCVACACCCSCRRLLPSPFFRQPPLVFPASCLWMSNRRCRDLECECQLREVQQIV
ncbi:hypothetical protein PIB30_053364 [Stylosanthes scabra]|uniref:Uncharacterized protein n=1 Tax=Stylosanthes scabra TaxID=79078 RepID=A0ABU6ZH96_9FABA|nr:hypothetical protein [Stylosanthes scabra]